MPYFIYPFTELQIRNCPISFALPDFYFYYSKVPLLGPPMGPTQSGLNSESVLIARPYGMTYSVCDKTCSCTPMVYCMTFLL